MFAMLGVHSDQTHGETVDAVNEKSIDQFRTTQIPQAGHEVFAEIAIAQRKIGRDGKVRHHGFNGVVVLRQSAMGDVARMQHQIRLLI